MGRHTIDVTVCNALDDNVKQCRETMFDADVDHEPMRNSLCDMSGPMFDANIEREPKLRNMHVNS